MDLAPQAKLRTAGGAGIGVRERLGAPAVASRIRSAAAVGAVVAVAVGVVLRFVATSELWLDEALAVNIASLPLGDLPDALRHDGAPPLYYALLHVWMELFGDGPVAVRALSGVASAGALPLAWAAGRRLGGRTVACGALLLLASSPFAVRYATEARMYSLVVLLVLAGHLALARALERPSPGRLVAVAAVSGLLLLTHYWSLFLAAAVAAALLPQARRPGDAGRCARRCLAAVGAGFLALVPWLPVLIHQALHTGTPWAVRPGVVELPDTVTQFAGGRTDSGSLLALLFVVLLVLALFGRAVDGRRIELNLSGRPDAVSLAFVIAATLASAFAVSLVTASAFVSRYASVVLAPFLLLVALGLRSLAADGVRHGVLAAVVVLGLLGGVDNVDSRRTQAGAVARAVQRLAGRGDVLAYCPDQLGPAVSRLLGGTVTQVTFPDGGDPTVVDWVDYAERNRAGDPEEFARRLITRAGPRGDVFLVWAPGYRGLRGRCEVLNAELSHRRRAVVRVPADRRSFERMTLMHFPAQ